MKTIIKSKNEGSSVSAFLSQGLESQNYIVNVLIDAFDVYGDFASATISVKVNPISFADLSEALKSQISLAYKTLDGDKVASVVGAATKALNGADCSMAMTCGSFNRHACMYIANTCGPCFDGHVGVEGDANTFCRPIEDIAGARRLSDSESNNENNKSSEGRMHLLGAPMEREWEYIDGSLCNVNINCYSGHCYRGKCARYTKKCPNECSGTLSNPQGTCKYYNEFDAEIETCAMYDLKCRAVCDCLDGFYGMDCSISRRSDYESIRTMKESLCLDVYRTLNIQDLDGNVIAQRAETVNDALLDPNLITDLGFVHCSNFMIETIAKAPLEAASSAAIEGVYQALSIILEGDRLGYLPFTLIHNVTSLVEVIATMRQHWLAAGEENVPYIADNLRVQIVKDHYEKVSGEVYTMPLSELDREYDTTTPTAELVSTVPNAENSYKSLGVTTIQYSRNIMQVPTVITTTSSFVGVYYNLFDNEEPDDGIDELEDDPDVWHHQLGITTAVFSPAGVVMPAPSNSGVKRLRT